MAGGAPDTLRVMILDDDAKLNTLLTEYLESCGLAVRSATHPDAGLRALRADPPDLLILDVMLPGMDGFEVLRKIRESSRLPVIMLTARDGVTDRVVGLEIGADDYLSKPFEPRELIARIRAVLRRGRPAEAGEVLRAGRVELNWATREARLDGHVLALTGGEFDLLGLLVRHRGRVLSRDRILENTRGIDWEAYDRSVDVLVSRVRQKLGDDPRQPAFIRTVRGVGYLFIGGGDA